MRSRRVARGRWRRLVRPKGSPLAVRMRDAMGTRSPPPADPGHPIVVHLIDGTYELFRHFYGQRRFNKGKDRRFGAVVGVLQGVLEFVERGETHLGVATDHVIESFRNRLWA